MPSNSRAETYAGINAAPGEYMTEETDTIDGRTPDQCFMLIARCSQLKNVTLYIATK